MKRKIILAVITVCLLAAFGALLRSPPSLIDAVTGATRRSRRPNTAAAAIVAPSKYTLIINTSAPPLDDEATRLIIRRAVLDEAVAADFSLESVSLRLAIAEGDTFLSRRAKTIAKQLEAVGFGVAIDEYSEIMFISRAVHGKYGLLLMADDGPALPNFANAENIVIATVKEDI